MKKQTAIVRALIYRVNTAQSSTMHQLISIREEEVNSKLNVLHDCSYAQNIEILFNGFITLGYPLAFILTDPAIQSALAQAVLAGQRSEREGRSLESERIKRSKRESEISNQECREAHKQNRRPFGQTWHKKCALEDNIL